MSKRSRLNLIEESIITLHFASPTTPEEAEVLNALKEAGSKKYLKTVERTKMIAEWYAAWKATVFNVGDTRQGRQPPTG